MVNITKTVYRNIDEIVSFIDHEVLSFRSKDSEAYLMLFSLFVFFQLQHLLAFLLIENSGSSQGFEKDNLIIGTTKVHFNIKIQ